MLEKDGRFKFYCQTFST